tara:strand:- start:116 stop:358 length:243 start_codon:yes stop_codon:yes gene_type:complete
MGKVKTKDDKVVFEDIDKEIEKAKPKKVKKTEEKPKEVKSSKTNLEDDLNKLGNWVADMDLQVREMEKLLTRVATRLGME